MVQVQEEESQLVVFSLNNTFYGVDVKQVREITELRKITAIPGSSFFVEGVTNLRGQVTKVIDLRKRFGLDEAEKTKDNRIIIVEPKGIPIGMIVDNVMEVMRLGKGAIESSIDLTDDSTSSYIEGIAKLEDGTLMIVIDIEQIIMGV